MHYMVFQVKTNQNLLISAGEFFQTINLHTYESWVIANIDEITIIKIWLYPVMNMNVLCVESHHPQSGVFFINGKNRVYVQLNGA